VWVVGERQSFGVDGRLSVLLYDDSVVYHERMSGCMDGVRECYMTKEAIMGIGNKRVASRGGSKRGGRNRLTHV
jgi:hypothetical protein